MSTLLNIRSSTLVDELTLTSISGITSFLHVGTLIIVLSSTAILISYFRVLRQRSTLPPGPFPLPIVGNCLQLVKLKPWLQYKDWSRQYNSGLITVWIGRTPNVICNDAWSASELMDKRSSIYSSRPRYVVMGEVTGLSGSNQVILPYNDHWRSQRKVMHTALGSQVVRKYRDFQADESRVLMRDLSTDSEHFARHFERYAGSLVSIVGWGRRMDSYDDYVLKLALRLMDDVTMMQVPGHFWMEAIPEMRYLPAWLYPLPANLKVGMGKIRKFWWALNTEAAQRSEANFAKRLVRSKDEEGLSEGDIGEMTSNLIGGGLDTSSSTLHTCALALCMFPGAQAKAHEELDRVVGRDRMPEWDDLESLPYCKAVFKETMRWRSVTTLGGFAHAPIEDDTYYGYRFPAGIHIFGNLWAIHSQPNDFPNPDTFDPDRFLGGENHRPYPNKTGHSGFGWGRRSCSGQYFAEQSLSMTIARMLWAFDVQPGLDQQGLEVPLDMWAYTDNENTQPLTFKARFTPRDAQIRGLVLAEAASARDRLRRWDVESTVQLEDFSL